MHACIVVNQLVSRSVIIAFPLIYLFECFKHNVSIHQWRVDTWCHIHISRTFSYLSSLLNPYHQTSNTEVKLQNCLSFGWDFFKTKNLIHPVCLMWDIIHGLLYSDTKDIGWVGKIPKHHQMQKLYSALKPGATNC